MFIEDRFLVSYQNVIKQVDFFDITGTPVPSMAG